MNDKVHLYLEIGESKSNEYGRTLWKSLNEIYRRQGEIVSISRWLLEWTLPGPIYGSLKSCFA